VAEYVQRKYFIALCVGAHAVLTRQYKYTQNLTQYTKKMTFFREITFFPY